MSDFAKLLLLTMNRLSITIYYTIGILHKHMEDLLLSILFCTNSVYKDLRNDCSVSGGLRHVYDSNDILFVGDTMDMSNCYDCDDDVKHPEGSSTYQAGHMGHCAYDE